MSLVNKKGVDISSLNEDVNIEAIKKAGYEFAMLRCGQGTRIIDSYFDRNVRKVEKIGMPWGVYLLTEATTTAEAQAEVEFADRLIKAQIAKGYKPTLPIAIDIEEAGFNSGDYTPSVLTNTARVWVEGMKKRGYYPAIYTGYYDIRDYIARDVINSCDIWLAEWGRYPDYQESNLGLWQFSDGATDLVEFSPRIPGAGCQVDKNICYKDYPSIIKSGGFNGWAKGSAAAPTVEDPIGSDEPDVATVQRWLNSNYNTGIDVDGIYGRLTKTAHVKALQIELSRRGAELEVDGIFGPCTKSAVYNLSIGDSGNLVYILQGLLLCNGYGAGGFDGIFGAGTEAAVLAYQYQNALAADGIAGRETFESLCA